MINPVELFVGLRYLRAKRRTRFVSFITLISLVGIALGVAALIVILSVMNGFEGELRNRLLSMSAHGTVTATDGVTEDWQQVVSEVSAQPGIAAAAPIVQMEGMIQASGKLFAVLVHGVDPYYEEPLSGAMINMVEGSLGVLEAGGRGIVLGRILAFDLGARIGDGVLLLIPRPVGDGTLEPVLERFVLRGVFEAGLQDHDASLALVHASDAAAIQALGTAVSAVRFRAEDVMDAPRLAGQLQQQLGDNYRTSDWTIENGSYFRAIRLEKMMMSLMLSLIIVLIGVVLGVVLAINVPVIAPFLEQLFGFQIMPGDVYYVTRIPSELEMADVGIIALAAFVLTSLATLYPARRAALVNPAAALRYE